MNSPTTDIIESILSFYTDNCFLISTPLELLSALEDYSFLENALVFPTESKPTCNAETSIYSILNTTSCNSEAFTSADTCNVEAKKCASPTPSNFSESSSARNTNVNVESKSPNKKKRKDCCFTNEELERLQSNMKKPRAKYNRNVSKPYDSMVQHFKYK